MDASRAYLSYATNPFIKHKVEAWLNTWLSSISRKYSCCINFKSLKHIRMLGWWHVMYIIYGSHAIFKTLYIFCSSSSMILQNFEASSQNVWILKLSLSMLQNRKLHLRKYFKIGVLTSWFFTLSKNWFDSILKNCPLMKIISRLEIEDAE